MSGAPFHQLAHRSDRGRETWLATIYERVPSLYDYLAKRPQYAKLLRPPYGNGSIVLEPARKGIAKQSLTWDEMEGAMVRRNPVKTRVVKNKEAGRWHVAVVTPYGLASHNTYATKAEAERVHRGMAKPGDPTVETLARKFSEVLRRWLTPKEMLTVAQRNVKQAGEGTCASHDFCDANMAMLEAYESFGKAWGRRALDMDDDVARNLWNEAWDRAQANAFWVKGAPKPPLASRQNPSEGMAGFPHTWLYPGGVRVRRGDLIEYHAYAGMGRKGPEYKPAKGKVHLIGTHGAVVVRVGGSSASPTVVEDKHFIRLVRKARS